MCNIYYTSRQTSSFILGLDSGTLILCLSSPRSHIQYYLGLQLLDFKVLDLVLTQCNNN